MHGDALCHVFDSGIGGHTAARHNQLEIIADAPFTGGEFCTNVDQPIQEQHRLAMQNELSGRHPDQLSEFFAESRFVHSIAILLELA
jgi:hypothetical protein